MDNEGIVHVGCNYYKLEFDTYGIKHYKCVNYEIIGFSCTREFGGIMDCKSFYITWTKFLINIKHLYEVKE